jgi:ribosomal protein L11 methyltransferase
VPFRRVLDLGCGSGVLAIAAARALPRAHIVASDIDPLATAVARGNVARNRVRARVRLVTAKGAANSTLRAGAPYDLLLANILAGPLVRLAPDLVPLMAWGGRAVLSGILADQASEVVAAWRTAGAKLIEGRTLAGWTTLVLRRG